MLTLQAHHAPTCISYIHLHSYITCIVPPHAYHIFYLAIHVSWDSLRGAHCNLIYGSTFYADDPRNITLRRNQASAISFVSSIMHSFANNWFQFTFKTDYNNWETFLPKNSPFLWLPPFFDHTMKIVKNQQIPEILHFMWK